MKKVVTDIGHVADVHRTFVEYIKDTGLDSEPLTDMWLYKYADPNFFCHMFKHGRSVVGMYWGINQHYLKEPSILVDGLFVRRHFRGKIKYIRAMIVELHELLAQNKVKKLLLVMPSKRLGKRKAKVVVMERVV